MAPPLRKNSLGHLQKEEGSWDLPPACYLGTPTDSFMPAAEYLLLLPGRKLIPLPGDSACLQEMPPPACGLDSHTCRISCTCRTALHWDSPHCIPADWVRPHACACHLPPTTTSPGRRTYFWDAPCLPPPHRTALCTWFWDAARVLHLHLPADTATCSGPFCLSPALLLLLPAPGLMQAVYHCTSLCLPRTPAACCSLPACLCWEILTAC